MSIEGEANEPAALPVVPPKADWRKARLPNMSQSTTAEDALADIVLGCVEHMRGNEACVMGRAHDEGVHQMRVAVRRLRSCLALYARLIPAEQHDYLVGELRWLIGELGSARDWDVFVGEILQPVQRQFDEDDDPLGLLSADVERHRDEAYIRAQAAVGSQRYLGLVLLLFSWAEGRGWRDSAADDQMSVIRASAADIAHDLLQQIYHDLLAAGEGFEHLDSEARHKVRIQLKKLRYATEFFSSLYSKRKVTPYLAAMKTLQDDLGTSNDVDVAKKLLKRVLKRSRGKERARLAYAAGMVVGWHGHVGDGREQQVVGAWSRLIARTPYWQTLLDAAAHRTAPDAIVAPEPVETVPPSPEAGSDHRADGAPEDQNTAGRAVSAPSTRRRVTRRPAQRM